MTNEITIKLPNGLTRLPDNSLWKNRVEIHSETSDRVYIIAQNKESGKFACSCPAWRTRRYCKHLLGIGLDASQIHGSNQISSKNQKKLT